MEQTFVSTSDQDTKSIAGRLVASLEKGTTICLWGDLAAGKTTFTQGIALELGIGRLTSPTFIIMREYPVLNNSYFKTLYHLDLYRLNSPDEIKAFDIDEIIADPQNLVVIEWPEKFGDQLPKDRIDVYFKITDDNEREIKIIPK